MAGWFDTSAGPGTKNHARRDGLDHLPQNRTFRSHANYSLGAQSSALRLVEIASLRSQ
jgi:hypothetical protein